MEHGLLPTEASIAFLILLLLIYTKKQQFHTSMSILYRWYMSVTITYAFLQVISIVILKYLTDGILFTILWRAQFILFIIAIYLIFLYGFTTIYKIETTKFSKIVQYNKDTKFITVLAAIFIIVMLLPIKMSLIDFVTRDNIRFMTIKTGFITIGIMTMLSIYFAIRLYKNKDNVSKQLKTSYIVALPLFIACLGGQTWYKESTIPITVLMYIGYLLYYLIENPDILYLNEQKRIEQELKKDDKQTVDLFEIVDDSLNVSVEEIVQLTKKLKNIEISEEEKNQTLVDISKKSKLFLEHMETMFAESQLKEEQETNLAYDTVEMVYSLKNYVNENKQNADIKLVMNISSTLPKKLYGDYEKIYKAITNILSYCCKNTNYGRITISILNAKSEFGEKIVFKINDTSTGIAEHKEHEILENDINLNVSKNYIELLKGTLYFESTHNVGNMFNIALIQEIADPAQIGDISKYQEIRKERSHNSFANKKILVVDDTIENLALTKAILERYHLEVEIIDKGNECIRKIKSEEEFDMIFLDIMMPEVDGIEVLHALKELEGYELPPIIALTGNALPGMKTKYLNEGFDDYLSKPIQTKELERVLDKYLK